MPWYAIRTVYQFGQKADGTHVFEERVVAVEADSWEHASAKGDAEAEAYAAENGFEAHPEQIAYELDGAARGDCEELWSDMFQARLSLAAFYAQRYEAYAFVPDEEN